MYRYSYKQKSMYEKNWEKALIMHVDYACCIILHLSVKSDQKSHLVWLYDC